MVAPTGNGFKWFLFPKATVTLAGGQVLVRDGGCMSFSARPAPRIVAS